MPFNTPWLSRKLEHMLLSVESGISQQTASSREVRREVIILSSVCEFVLPWNFSTGTRPEKDIILVYEIEKRTSNKEGR